MANLKTSATNVVKQSYDWLELRLGLIKPMTDAAIHPTPSSNASWLYVFGSAATVLLILQVVTGVLLALVYSTSASEAWAYQAHD
jgi:ubiquinol-cytochrome c reductase cytochrome b subunit